MTYYPKSTRKLTREQFSSKTTIDGDRLERALSDAGDEYNNLPISSFSAMTSKQIYWSFTPSMGVSFLESDQDDNSLMYYKGIGFADYFHHPVLQTVHDGLINSSSYRDAGEPTIQNPITYKGVGRNPQTNEYDSINPDIEYKYRWENTYLTKKPVIIKELSFMGMWDDAFQRTGSDAYEPLLSGGKYFANDFINIFNGSLVEPGFQVIIAVDNNLGLSNTINRDIETRVYNVSMDNFFISSWGNTTNPDFGMTYNKWEDNSIGGNGDIHPYPQPNPDYLDIEADVKSVPAGTHIQLKDLNIPIHENGRIKITFVFPKTVINPRNVNPPNTIWQISNTIGSLAAFDNYTTPSCLTNMWSCTMTVLEELDKE